MRDILFRGKRIDSGEWVYGAFCPDALELIGLAEPGVMDGFIRSFDTKTKKMVMHEVDRVTVGQYTGLTDKNGKKIFEGDVVCHENGYDDSRREIGKVFWEEEVCQWRRTSNGAFHHGNVTTYRMGSKCVYEVIGTIHDNPDLIGGADNG